MWAGPYCPETVLRSTSSGFITRMERSSLARSSRTELGRKVALGSMAIVANTCNR